MLWRRSARVFDKYSNLMSDKDSNLKERLRQALSSTIRVISEDFEIKKKSEEYKDSNKLDDFELDNLNNELDFIKARAQADSSALKKKFSNNKIYKKIYLSIQAVNLFMQ